MTPTKEQKAIQALRGLFASIPATPANGPRIMREAGAVLAAHGFASVRALGGVNHSSKTAKGQAYNVAQYTVYMAPHTSSGAGNLCPDATPGCIAACLAGSGRAAFDAKIPAARISRALIYFASRPHFSAVLFREIQKAKKSAQASRARFFARVNGTSDISPRAVKVDGVDVLQAFPGVSFFDYTKVWGRASIDYGRNYSLCFSWGDGRTWEDAAREVLSNGRALAVPFASMNEKGRIKQARAVDLPTAFGRVDQDGRELFTVPVIDGDKFDARPLDRIEGGAPKEGGYIVGLRAKRSTVEGEREALASGFFVPI